MTTGSGTIVAHEPMTAITAYSGKVIREPGGWGPQGARGVRLDREGAGHEQAARVDWRQNARDLRAPAMAIGSNPLRTTRKSAQTGVISSATE